MSQRIVIKRSSVAGRVPTGLNAGELALNMSDRLLYSADASGNVFVLNSSGDLVVDPTVLTKNTVAAALGF